MQSPFQQKEHSLFQQFGLGLSENKRLLFAELPEIKKHFSEVHALI